MTTAAKPIKGRAYPHAVALVNSIASATFVASPVVAASNVKLSKDFGVTWTNITAAPVVNGVAVKLVPDATEMTTDSLLVWINGVAGCADLFYEILTKDPSFAFFPFVMRDMVGQEAPAATVTAQYSYDAVTWAALPGTVVNDGNGDYRVPIGLAIAANYTDFIRLRFTAPNCMTTKTNVMNQY